MGWTWRYLDQDGSTVSPEGVPGAAEDHPAQGDAETWVGETWRALRDAGVASVVLLEEDREVYGPMSLDPA